jgi:hypothetical protein
MMTYPVGNLGDEGQSWWLRSPGNLNSRAAFVNEDDCVDTKGTFVGECLGTRLALWLSLKDNLYLDF